MNPIKLIELEVKEILKEKQTRPEALESLRTDANASALHQKAVQALYAEAFHRALRRLRFQS